jgi:2'-5' RNA ligase
MTVTRDHWTATDPLWQHGDDVLTWHFTFEELPPVQALARRLRPALDLPYLDVVPSQWLHLTTQGVGLSADVRADHQARIVLEAADRLASERPPAATLGRPGLFEDSVGVPVEDNGRLQTIRLRLQEADAAVRGAGSVPDWRTEFQPHVTLAYANAVADAADLILPDTSVAVTFQEVSLIRLHRTRGLYSWDVLGRVPIG